MKKEVAMKWAAALRSGKYQQTYGRLRRDEPYTSITTPLGDEPRGHCCLGVLCELAVDGGAAVSYLANEIYLPEDVWTWAGLDGNDPALSLPLEEVQLTGLNDSKNWSFERIAGLIEERWEEL